MTHYSEDASRSFHMVNNLDKNLMEIQTLTKALAILCETQPKGPAFTADDIACLQAIVADRISLARHQADVLHGATEFVTALRQSVSVKMTYDRSGLA